MGIFDDLKKLGQDLGKEIEKNVGADTLKNIKDAVAGAASAGGNKNKEIPEEYSEFPKFREECTDLTTKKTDKYIRCTMNFYNVTDREVEDYIYKLRTLGYERGSDVRFDKGNTYIIVDNGSYSLNLVFHIKR